MACASKSSLPATNWCYRKRERVLLRPQNGNLQDCALRCAARFVFAPASAHSKLAGLHLQQRPYARQRQIWASWPAGKLARACLLIRLTLLANSLSSTFENKYAAQSPTRSLLKFGCAAAAAAIVVQSRANRLTARSSAPQAKIFSINSIWRPAVASAAAAAQPQSGRLAGSLGVRNRKDSEKWRAGGRAGGRLVAEIRHMFG